MLKVYKKDTIKALYRHSNTYHYVYFTRFNCVILFIWLWIIGYHFENNELQMP